VLWKQGGVVSHEAFKLHLKDVKTVRFEMHLTEHERLHLWGMRHAFQKADVSLAISEFTQGISDLLEFGEASHLYRALAGFERIKLAFESIHNNGHTIAMLAAKAFLEAEAPEVPWQNIEFAQHANRNGADLRVDEFLIVAELKTTEPCGRSRKSDRPVTFGAQQKNNIEGDLRKLAAPQYRDFRKYMFVTSPLAYHCLLRDYRAAFPSLCFILLSAAPTVSRPTT
jgi:hypothetical protein